MIKMKTNKNLNMSILQVIKANRINLNDIDELEEADDIDLNGCIIPSTLECIVLKILDTLGLVEHDIILK